MHNKKVLPESTDALFLEYAHDLRTEQTEKVLLLFLDDKLDVIAKSSVTQHSTFQTEFCARTVFAPALIHDARNVVLIHNHPSGSVVPSPADYLTTVVLSHAGSVLQISLIDHLIVTKNDYFSFRKAGIL